MEGVFLGGSLLAAFVAGSVALFAPCCIMVMFPAYLAAAVRNHRWRLVPLTFVFAALQYPLLQKYDASGK